MAFREGNGFVQDQIDRNSAATRLRSIRGDGSEYMRLGGQAIILVGKI
ncbi:hypothetical protein [Mesorhizobium sp.]|nr:hypothetical protein [Mesorhizobium sp.]